MDKNERIQVMMNDDNFLQDFILATEYIFKRDFELDNELSAKITTQRLIVLKNKYLEKYP